MDFKKYKLQLSKNQIFSTLINILSISLISAINYFAISYFNKNHWSQNGITIIIFIRRVLPPLMVLFFYNIELGRLNLILFSIALISNAFVLQFLFPNFFFALITSICISLGSLIFNKTKSQVIRYTYDNFFLNKFINDISVLIGFYMAASKYEYMLLFLLSSSSLLGLLSASNYAKHESQEITLKEKNIINMNKNLFVFMSSLTLLFSFFSTFLFLILKINFQTSNNSVSLMSWFLISGIILSTMAFKIFERFKDNQKKVLFSLYFIILISLLILLSQIFNKCNILKYLLLLLGATIGLLRVFIAKVLIEKNYNPDIILSKFDLAANIIVPVIGLLIPINLNILNIATIILSTVCLMCL